MKNKKVTAAGIALISAITMLVCSCRSNREQTPAKVISTTKSDCKEAPNINSVTPNEPPSSIPDAPTVLSPSPVKLPKYDDPESYLKYDPENDTYIPTDEEKRLGEESLFVGDSICSGFSAWGVLESKNVFAMGNVAAWSLLDYDMYYRNKPAKLVPVLKKAKPKRVFFWMGMNDVNMTSAEQYCENYKKIIDLTLENSDADVYVCAITPISDLKFTRLDYINEFNDAIKHYIMRNYEERVHFVSFADPLKTPDGLLNDEYNGGDGIHLGKKAYFIALHELNKQIKKANLP